jgi:hypothetical protein
VGAALTFGCTGSESSSVAEHVVIMVDRSASADDKLEAFRARVGQLALEPGDTSRLTVYAFDQKVQELYDNAGGLGEEQVGRITKRLTTYESFADRTDLRAALTRCEARLKGSSAELPKTVWLLTDCGVERMTDEDIREARAKAKAIAKLPQFKQIRVVGLDDGQREPIRRIFDLPEDQFFIED